MRDGSVPAPHHANSCTFASEHTRARDLRQVLMMGEIDHLPHPPHLREQAQRLLGAEMVEGFHDVVGDEGRRDAGAGEFVIAGDAQRQIELKPRTLGELIGFLGAAVAAKRD